MGRVREEVQEHLLELVRVRRDLPQRRLELGDDPHALEREVGILELQRAPDDLVDVDGAPLRRTLPRECQQLADDPRGPAALALDRAGALPRRVGERVVGAEQLGRHQDRRQRVVELVGDAGQQRAERFQLVGLDELVLRLLQLAQSRLQLRIEASLLDRHRRLVRDAGENPALLVAQAARSAVIDG